MDPRVAEIRDALEKLRRKIQHQEKDDARELAELERILLTLKPQQRVRPVEGCKGLSEEECRKTGELRGCRWKKWGRSSELSCGQTRTRIHERDRILSSLATSRPTPVRSGSTRPTPVRQTPPRSTPVRQAPLPRTPPVRQAPPRPVPLHRTPPVRQLPVRQALTTRPNLRGEGEQLEAFKRERSGQ